MLTREWRREPVHAFYGGAHLFRAGVCRKLGNLAQQVLAEHAPDAAALARAFEIPDALAETVYARVLEKLEHEPLEDFHIDFEDGFGIRSDDEEDAAAQTAAAAMAEAMHAGTMPPFSGIRIKPLDDLWKTRSLRTLHLFLDTLLSRTGGRIPGNFAVTLPKITAPEQVSMMAYEIEPIPGVNLEIMIETPQALLALPALMKAAHGRCTAAHFGAYDYTSTLGITAGHQSLLHPACDFARASMQVQLAGSGVRLSDGVTNVLPLSSDREAVQGAWKLHYTGVRHALECGFYQGWDLHPAQLPARYAAVYTFFLEGLDAASRRLRNFVAQAARATQVDGVFDDAATGQGLLNYFLRAANCGAIPESALPELTGMNMEQLRLASFIKISEAQMKLI